MLQQQRQGAADRADRRQRRKGYVSRSKIALRFDDKKKVAILETPGGNCLTLSDDKGASCAGGSERQLDRARQGRYCADEQQKSVTLKRRPTSSRSFNAEIKASSGVKVKGSGTAEISSSGKMTVKGSLVMIN